MSPTRLAIRYTADTAILVLYDPTIPADVARTIHVRVTDIVRKLAGLDAPVDVAADSISRSVAPFHCVTKIVSRSTRDVEILVSPR